MRVHLAAAPQTAYGAPQPRPPPPAPMAVQQSVPMKVNSDTAARFRPLRKTPFCTFHGWVCLVPLPHHNHRRGCAHVWLIPSRHWHGCRPYLLKGLAFSFPFFLLLSDMDYDYAESASFTRYDSAPAPMHRSGSQTAGRVRCPHTVGCCVVWDRVENKLSILVAKVHASGQCSSFWPLRFTSVLAVQYPLRVSHVAFPYGQAVLLPKENFGP